MVERVAPLPVGIVAPTFTLPHTPHASVSLHGLLGLPVVLLFYPIDWDPVTRQQLARYQEHADAFSQHSAVVLGISVDHPLSQQAFARYTPVRFPLLSDWQPKGAVARLYGVYRERQGVSARAVFVLDRDGVVRFSQAYPDEHNPGVDQALDTLEALAPRDDR